MGQPAPSPGHVAQAMRTDISNTGSDGSIIVPVAVCVPMMQLQPTTVQQQDTCTRTVRRCDWAASKLNEDDWTTLMIRNLPSRYTRDNLMSLLLRHGYFKKFDFLYFPIDFQTRATMGYAFVNLQSPADAVGLWRSLDGFSDWSVPCSKVCSVSWSQPLQGLAAHIARYRNSPLMHELVPDTFRPVLFMNGERVPFPVPTKKVHPPRKGAQRMLVPQW